MVATSQQSNVPLRRNEYKAKIVRAALGAEGKCLLFVFELEGSDEMTGDSIRLSPYPQLDRLAHLAYAVGIPCEDGPPTDPAQFLFKRVIVVFNDKGEVTTYYRPPPQPARPIGWDHYRFN